jgi:hypothetical protein
MIIVSVRNVITGTLAVSITAAPQKLSYFEQVFLLLTSTDASRPGIAAPPRACKAAIRQY